MLSEDQTDAAHRSIKVGSGLVSVKAVYAKKRLVPVMKRQVYVPRDPFNPPQVLREGSQDAFKIKSHGVLC
jgi:hypothetical protein